MRLEDLHRRLGKILIENPSYRFMPVLYWRGRMTNGVDAFGSANEIITCAIDNASNSTLTGRQNCIVLSPIIDFRDFQRV